MRSSAKWILAGVALMTAAYPARAQSAAPADVEKLAEQWRAAKRAQLVRQQDEIAAQLAALDQGATPDTLAAVAAAQPTQAPQAEPPPAQAAGDKADKADAERDDGDKGDKNEKDKQKFGGIEFGIGVSFTADLGSRDRIGEAMLDPNGIVRIKDENNGRARIMLESHYFFTPCRAFVFRSLGENSCTRGKPDPDKTEWGFGPFIALQPGGEENVIEAIGMGLMVGFRKNPATTQSFNFGIGYVVDPNTRVLGDGIVQDQPLPAGETEIRYKETSQSGLLFLASFSF